MKIDWSFVVSMLIALIVFKVLEAVVLDSLVEKIGNLEMFN